MEVMEIFLVCIILYRCVDTVCVCVCVYMRVCTYVSMYVHVCILVGYVHRETLLHTVIADYKAGFFYIFSASLAKANPYLGSYMHKCMYGLFDHSVTLVTFSLGMCGAPWCDHTPSVPSRPLPLSCQHQWALLPTTTVSHLWRRTATKANRWDSGERKYLKCGSTSDW